MYGCHDHPLPDGRGS